MVKSTVNLAQRTQVLSQSVESQLKRCHTLTQEAEALVRERRSEEQIGRGMFTADLITEAQNKLVECKLVAGNFSNQTADDVTKLAITERWLRTAIDLLNQAQMVLDDRKDIWGKDLPTGGLWDK